MTTPTGQPSAAVQRESGASIHRRETRRTILLPFALSMLVIVAIFLISALLSDPLARSRISLIADFLSTIVILCPSVLVTFLCLLPIVAGIYGMFRVHRAVGTPLQKLETMTEGMAERVETMSTTVNQRTMTWSEKVASWTYFMSILDTGDNTDKDNTQETQPHGSEQQQ